ncbi:hypothetical protein [Ornithinimicrobium sp. W1665]|uniref:hypothetical protein n=1 Tax=Ornithinimicrobium sp. W1665 TaxID=3416666 RepID=UPI003D6AA6FD
MLLPPAPGTGCARLLGQRLADARSSRLRTARASRSTSGGQSGCSGAVLSNQRTAVRGIWSGTGVTSP